MTAEQARDVARAILAHANMIADPKDKIENAGHEIRHVVRKRTWNSLWTGIAIGIGATLIVGIVAMLFLGFCNHMHLPMG